MSETKTDEFWMTQALSLADEGTLSATPNPRVGCVLVKRGQVVGAGFHARAGESHAETLALAEAGSKARGATAYVTLEPCAHHARTPPCAAALIKARVARVVAAMQDPNPKVSGQGLAALREAGIKTSCGTLETQAKALNPGFIKRMSQGMPWLRCKMAMSIDGRTAMASGESVWITGKEARQDAQKIRAQSCAVIIGSGTALTDNPRLSARIETSNGERLSERQPLRAVIDSRGRVSRNLRLFQEPGEALIFTAETDDVERVCLPERDGRIEPRAVLRWLAQERQCNEVLLEGGAMVAGNFLEKGLIDELILYIAPKILGDTARALFQLQIEELTRHYRIKINDMSPIGEDWRLIAMPLHNQPRDESETPN